MEKRIHVVVPEELVKEIDKLSRKREGRLKIGG
jgi:metal-responsive CopG/Arc/MetJ family transcriptional regulator